MIPGIDVGWVWTDGTIAVSDFGRVELALGARSPGVAFGARSPGVALGPRLPGVRIGPRGPGVDEGADI